MKYSKLMDNNKIDFRYVFIFSGLLFFVLCTYGNEVDVKGTLGALGNTCVAQGSPSPTCASVKGEGSTGSCNYLNDASNSTYACYDCSSCTDVNPNCPNQPTSCDSGKYLVTDGYLCNVCYGCPAGYYCPDNSDSKVQCPDGTTSPPGSVTVTQCVSSCGTEPSSCQPGYYLTSNNGCKTCERCPSGKYCTGGSYQPKNCGVGEIPNSNASGCVAENNSSCPSGAYEDRAIAESNASSYCGGQNRTHTVFSNANCFGYRCNDCKSGYIEVNGNCTDNNPGNGGGTPSGGGGTPSGGGGDVTPPGDEEDDGDDNNDYNTDDDNIDDSEDGGNDSSSSNPQTGNIITFIVIFLGFVMVGYAVYYYSVLKDY